MKRVPKIALYYLHYPFLKTQTAQRGERHSLHVGRKVKGANFTIDPSIRLAVTGPEGSSKPRLPAHCNAKHALDLDSTLSHMNPGS